MTVTGTVPVACAGAVAFTCVEASETTTAGVAPKSTPLAVERFVPEITTDVPPVVVPLVGVSELIVGTAS